MRDSEKSSFLIRSLWMTKGGLDCVYSGKRHGRWLYFTHEVSAKELYPSLTVLLQSGYDRDERVRDEITRLRSEIVLFMFNLGLLQKKLSREPW